MDKLKKALGPALIEEGLLSEEDYVAVQQELEKGGERLCKLLISLGFIEELKLAVFLSKYCDLPFVNLNNQKIDPKITKVISSELARKYILIPLFLVRDTLTVAMADPIDYKAIEELEYITKKRIEPVVSIVSDINSMLDKYYGAQSSINQIINNLQSKDLQAITIESLNQKAFATSDASGPINKLLHLIISYAIREKASDIHFEPTDMDLQIRFRIDGVLHKTFSFPKNICASLISTIKILARMDIAEKRIPLDGGFQVKVENYLIDLRVSSFPVLEGEKIAMRILNKANMLLNLEDLGLAQQTIASFLPLISRSHGIMLITGPTGSGKTSTLYSILNRIKSTEKNIVTIEDPIEYRLELINQSQINPKAGLSFSNGLRYMLRQDPDIILVGEIRDLETAEIAFQAALTGHLVFSTLHTNDAASSVTRLLDMGIEPYLVASSLIGVLAQRLIRKICPVCKKEYEPTPEELEMAGISLSKELQPKGVFSITPGEKPTKKLSAKNHRFMAGTGCKDCRNSGFQGRSGIFELLTPDEKIRQMILRKATASEIKTAAIENGMITLQEDGLSKVLESKTTIGEVMRVVR